MTKIANIIADFETQLAYKIAIGEKSCSIQNNIDNDGVTLPNGYYYFTLDGGSNEKEHIYCLLTGKNLTEIKSVSRQGARTEGVVREHRYGSSVGITNFATIQYINSVFDGTGELDGTTPIKYDADPTIDDDKMIGTKKYADGLTISDLSDASTSVKGVSKTSVAPASVDNPVLLGDNDSRVPTQDENDAMAGTSGTPSASNKFVTEDNSALDNNVDLDTNQTIAGVKTFSDIPVLPGNPTTDYQLANKAYADSLLN